MNEWTAELSDTLMIGIAIILFGVVIVVALWKNITDIEARSDSEVRRIKLDMSEQAQGTFQSPVIHEEYDDESGAEYLQISSMPVHKTREFKGTVLIDTDEKGRLRGIEFLDGGPLEQRICHFLGFCPKCGNAVNYTRIGKAICPECGK